MLTTTTIETPIGALALFANGAALVGVAFADRADRVVAHLTRHGEGEPIEQRAVPRALTAPLEAYFAGRLDALQEIAVEPRGTPFQQKVWRELVRIPVGETRSYARIARAIRSPDAVRAVGLANGSNPISIVVPCHRVIASDGGLGGYGGGLARKRWLLAHEGARHAGRPVTWQHALPLGDA